MAQIRMAQDTQVPTGSAEMVAATIRTIFAQPGAAAIRRGG
jgi:hypothetical protein